MEKRENTEKRMQNGLIIPTLNEINDFRLDWAKNQKTEPKLSSSGSWYLMSGDIGIHLYLISFIYLYTSLIHYKISIYTSHEILQKV